MKKTKILVFIAMGLLICCFVLTACNQETKCNHKDSEWTIVTESTCTSAGLKILECDKCGNQSKIIPATGHKWGAATCVEPQKCSVCDKTEGDPLGHNYVSSVKTEPTCTTKGVNLNTCSTCSDSYESEIEILGHSNVLNSTGQDVCSICNKMTYTTFSVKALSGIYSVLKSPTSANILSVCAGSRTWESKQSIVVVITLTAQNGYGGIGTATYVVLIDLATQLIISYDLVGDMEDKIDYYERCADMSTGQTKLDYMDKAQDYRLKLITALQYKSYITNAQDLSYIDPIAREKSGKFN